MHFLYYLLCYSPHFHSVSTLNNYCHFSSPHSLFVP
jgi:hypothetical protein